MLLQLLLMLLLSTSPGQIPPSTLVDVSTLKIGAPARVAEVDGRLTFGVGAEVGTEEVHPGTDDARKVN